MTPRVFWKKRCRIAREAIQEFETRRALGIVIEGFLDALALAECKARWMTEIPYFATEVRRIFEPWEIAEYLHRSLSATTEDAPTVALWDWAKELLLQDNEIRGWPIETRRTRRYIGVR